MCRGFFMQVGIGVLFLKPGCHAGRPSGWEGYFSCPAPKQICLAIEVRHSEWTLGDAITAGLLNNPEMACACLLFTALLMYATGFMVFLWQTADQ